MLSFIIYFQTPILQTISHAAMIAGRKIEEFGSKNVVSFASLSNIYNILISKILFKGYENFEIMKNWACRILAMVNFYQKEIRW